MGFPPANRTAQWFYDTVGGANMGAVEKVVWHTTETTGWPSYDSGMKAPHYTVRPDFGARAMLWRQHFPDSVNSRAMRNDPGGVQTNLDGALQVEIVGTCDQRPDAPTWTHRSDVLHSWDLLDWQVDGLAAFVAWANREHGVPLSAPSLWLAYGKDPRAPGRIPASYGDSPARMTGGTWDRFRGHCGHLHAAENAHGDPGRMPMGQILARAHALLEPTPDTEDDDMQLSDKVRLGPSAAENLGQPDGEMTVEEVLVLQTAAAVVTNKLLVQTNTALAETNERLDALVKALTPPAVP